MSLRHFQQSWLDFTGQPERYAAFLRGELLCPLGLEPQEAESLGLLSAGLLKAGARLQAEQQQVFLQAVLPESVQHVLGAEHTAAVLAGLQARRQTLPFFSRQDMVSVLLVSVLDYLNTSGLIIPHLRDLVHYELAASQLCFFRLPAESPVAETLLAPWARLIRLGAHFPLYLRQLHHGLHLSETPRQAFLLLRDFQGLKLESLNALQTECLQRCQAEGRDFVIEVTAREGQTELSAVFRQYVQRGILRLP